jgi:hypothetical protein
MNKELKISMKFDTSDAEAAADKMYKKMKQIADLSKGPAQGQPGSPAGGANAEGGMFNKPGMENFFKSMDALRKGQDSAMRAHGKEQMKLMKDIYKEEERRGKLVQDQDKLSKNKNKDLQEELRIKKELKATEEQIARLNKQAGQANSGMLAAQMASGNTQPVFVTNWPTGGGNGAGGGGGGGGGRGGAGGNKFLSGIGKSLGGAAALLATGATLIDSYTSLPITKTGSLGSATQSIIGSNLQDIAQGNVVSSMAWMKEKQRAAEMAQSKFQSQMVTSPMNVVGGAMSLGKSVLGLGGGGAGKDADANYLMGAVTKTLSAALSIGAKGSIADSLSQGLGKASEEYFTTHQAQLMEDFGKNYESMLQAQQKENPLKNLAVNYLQDRYKTDQQAQRMMGQTDEQFYGRKGFMENANNAGFTGDMAMQSAQQIQAAGGSTRGMGNATLGLKAARGFDLTNASSILGTISGGAGSADSSERIFKRILEEGVKNGLDKSESVEELRRFSQATAEIVAKTGTVTGEDTSRIMESFSRFMNTGGGNIPTIKEEEGAKAAYEKYQTQSGQAGGRFGSLQYASMTKEGLGSIGPKAMGALMQMPEGDLNEDNDRVVAIAAANDMDPKELAEKVRKAKSNARDVNVQFDPKNRETLKNSIGFGKQSFQQLKNASPAARKAYEESILATSYQGYGGAQEAQAEAQGLRNGAVINPTTTAAGAGIGGRLDNAPGTRVSDDVTKAAGVAAQAMLENFRDFKKEITPAADALDMFTKKLIILGQVANMTPEKDRAAALSFAAQHAFTPMSSSQQAGKPQSGGGTR